ncbi:MAG: hypothetical protein HQL06_16970 [Nitrospirae bacterium]|nr:hypothetical protein [Nitrospirota bacterium]
MDCPVLHGNDKMTHEFLVHPFDNLKPDYILAIFSNIDMDVIDIVKEGVVSFWRYVRRPDDG